VNVSTATDTTSHVDDDMQAWLCVISNNLMSEANHVSPLSPGDSLHGQLSNRGDARGVRDGSHEARRALKRGGTSSRKAASVGRLATKPVAPDDADRGDGTPHGEAGKKKQNNHV